MSHRTQRFLLALSVLPVFAPAVTKEPALPPPPRYDADLFHKDTETVFMDAEFLYWTVQEGSLDYAQKMRQPAWSTATASYASGKVHSATFRAAPGIRFTAGYFNAPKYWEVRGQYTQLTSRGENRVEPPSGATQFLTGTWPQITTNPLTHAHSSIALNYDLFDALVDRVFILNPHFRLRFLAGLETAWIRQDWKIQYFDGTGQETTIRNRWHFVGGGLRMGVSGDWYWGNNVYITGQTTFGSLMGSYRNRSKQTANFQPTPDVNPSLPLRNSDFSDTRPVFNVQFVLGPSWQQNFSKYRVELFTGYELDSWFNAQETHRSSSALPAGTKETWLGTGLVTLHGLSSRLTANF